MRDYDYGGGYGYGGPPIYQLPPHHGHQPRRRNDASVIWAVLLLLVVASIFGMSLLRYGPSLFRAPVETNITITIDGAKQEVVPVQPNATKEVTVQTQAQPPPEQTGKYRTQQTFHRGENGGWETTDPYSQSDDWRVLTWSDSLYIPESRQEGRDPALGDFVDIKYDPANPTPEHTFVYYFSESADSLVQYSEAESEALFAADVDSGAIPLESISPVGLALYKSIKGGY